MTPKYKKRPRTNFLAVHCAATDPAWHGDVDIDDVRDWHTAKGWIDVGYHLYIPRNGVIQLGRPLWAVGAHVAGFNDDSIGICLEGGASVLTKTDPETGKQVFDGMVPTDKHFTEKQFQALVAILAALKVQYPEAVVQGHCDFPGVTKACPSFDVKGWWAQAKPTELLGTPLDE